uniref:Uncharacterized protein n=1 Tax=Peronospora matthiolae TaxID=2874970 RepID=A0AAV1UPQ8_9STRA
MDLSKGTGLHTDDVVTNKRNRVQFNGPSSDVSSDKLLAGIINYPATTEDGDAELCSFKLLSQ